MTKRITETFANKEKKLVTFVTGGDPNLESSKEIIKILAENGSDIIEIGMPFSDPMADGPTIQLSSNRAIKNGIDLDGIFSICKNFRRFNNDIPLILMGYYNIIFHYGVKNFVNECVNNGVDGLIVVDLQPEEDSELINLMKNTDLKFIRLITPTTDKKRLEQILNNSSGFLYYVTITGITGQHSADMKELNSSINYIKQKTNLPIVSGFGIKSTKQAKEACKISEGVVVGSSIIKIIEENLNDLDKVVDLIKKFVRELKRGIK